MILIRADGNETIGTGHVMRCLSVADALAEIGTDIRFLLADETMLPAIRQRGFAARVLDSDYRNMPDELDALIPYINECRPSRIIIDSYFVTPGYLNALNQLVSAVYMDDLASFAYPVDLLVNYNIYGQAIDYAAMYQSAGIKLPGLLLGPCFAPLRKMFQDIPRRKQREIVTDILVSTGGSDPAHMALRLLHEIEKNGHDIIWHFLVGALNPDRPEILDLAKHMGHIVIHENVSDMKSLISGCDIAISAAGSTMYEIAACGTPMITYVLADNQIPGAEAFQEQGMAVFCGDMRKESAGIIMEAAEQFSHDCPRRSDMGRKMQIRVDGRGAHRIAEKI